MSGMNDEADGTGVEVSTLHRNAFCFLCAHKKGLSRKSVKTDFLGRPFSYVYLNEIEKDRCLL